jgi:NIMA-interacting peptidyl-prolyl cis-trans isomerase 1
MLGLREPIYRRITGSTGNMVAADSHDVNHSSDENNNEVVDAAAVTAVADIAAAALAQTQQHQLIDSSQPPQPSPPLPEGWVLKESRSHPNYYYYYHQVTGVSSWQPPVDENRNDSSNNAQFSAPIVDKREEQQQINKKEQVAAAEASLSALPSSKKRLVAPNNEKQQDTASISSSSAKRAKTSAASKPKQVRILHILKKHKDARRPSSWRNPNITITKQQAEAELSGLIELLQEVRNDPADLRATMEELARTESDCSSAKRGGDLGFFGPKKMQPAFEEAAFALKIGELSGVVETSSGVHVLLRIG